MIYAIDDLDNSMHWPEKHKHTYKTEMGEYDPINWSVTARALFESTALRLWRLRELIYT